MGKRAQFYLIDAFFAAIILFVGVGFLLSSSSFTPQQGPARLLVADITNTLMVPALDDIQNEYTNQYFSLLQPDLSVASQSHVWWYENCSGCLSNATALAASVLNMQDSPFGVLVLLRNQTHNFTLVNQTSPLQREAQLMLVNQQILITDYEEGFLGPDILEVRVWQ
ncbi:MAG: hypothetical protein ACMXYD_02825 [Candidatus Woesearchaeota archaeon]